MFTIFFRTIILYLLIIGSVRLMGKRQVGELEPSELVLSFLIADLASVPMQDLGFPLHTGIIPILTLVAISTIFSVLTIRSLFFRNLLCGKPSIVMRDGKICQKEMRQNRLTVDELLEELRSAGHRDLETIQYAVLESNGMLSVVQVPEEQPVTLGQLQELLGKKATADTRGLPRVLVSDGVLLQEAVKQSGFSSSWVVERCKKKGKLEIKDVFLFILYEDGTYYVEQKEEC